MQPALRDLNKLTAFVRAAETGSFTRAAKLLRTSPSVISTHISDLEQNLGFSLLRRSTHGVALTEAGQGLFQRCLTMLADLDGYVVETRNAQTGAYGLLRIQIAPDLATRAIVPLLKDFRARYPNIRVELITSQSGLADIGEACDMAIGGSKPATPGMAEELIARARHVICATPHYLSQHGRPESPPDLRHHDCLVSYLTTPNGWRFRRGGQVSVFEIKGPISSDSATVLARLALDHAGIARLPYYEIRTQLADGSLEALLPDTTTTEQIQLYYPKAKPLPAKISCFLDFLREAIQSSALAEAGIEPPGTR